MCRTLLVRTAAVLTVVAAVLTACGDDQPPAAGPPGATAPPGPTARPGSPAPPTTAPRDGVDPVLAAVLAGERPVAAERPADLAHQITVGERAVRDPASRPELVAAGGRLTQVAYRALGRRPGDDRAVLAAVPGDLRDAVRHHVAAGREFAALVDELPDTMPTWRVVDPPPAEELLGYYRQAQRRFGVPWQVLAAVHQVETQTSRIVGLSAAGAQGPMQFIPETWDSYGLGGDVWDNHDAIIGAANYLAANGAADGTDEGIDNALFRYNNSEHYVRGVRHRAAVMRADERAFLGMHAWQVYYRTQLGDVLLPTGYELTRSIPVREWLDRHPR